MVHTSIAQSLNDPSIQYDASGGLFDTDSLRSINIEFYNANYHNILVQNWEANNGERLPARIDLSNGTTLDSVGIRYKGNSTFALANDNNNRKLPWNLDINHYVGGQRLMDYPKLKLANGYFDPTFCREVSAYKVYNRYMPSSEANFLRVNVDGQYLGLYLNTESVDRNFLEKHFGESDGVFFKCDPAQQFGQQGEMGDSDLSYLGTDTTDYYTHYSLKSDYGWDQMVKLTDIINNDSDQLDSIMNVDRALWAFAVNNVIANYDTYNGLFRHNYYLYQTKDGLFQMIPWDLSESYVSLFLGFVFDGNDLFEYDPYEGYGSVGTPLVNALTKDPQSLRGKIYTAHLRTLIKEQLETENIANNVSRYQELIRNSVAQDNNKLFNLGQFTSNVSSDLIIPFAFSSAAILPTIERRKNFLNAHPELLHEAPEIAEIDISINDNMSYVEVAVIGANKVELMVSNNGYQSKFKSFEMTDDGSNGDQVAGDGIYTSLMPYQQSPIELAYYIRAHSEHALSLLPERAEYQFFTFQANGDLVINECMASNESIAQDSEGEYEDWIELYNNGDEAIDLSGYFLSDDKSNLAKWFFPEGAEIAPQSYLIIWADGEVEQAGLHCSFSLNTNGETIYLSDNAGQLVDQMEFPALAVDDSYGRFPNGNGSFQDLFPSFDGENTLVSNLKDFNDQINMMTIFPSPAKTDLTVEFDSKRIANYTLEFINTAGKLAKAIDVCRDCLGFQRLSIDISSLGVGYYSVQLIFNEGVLSTGSFIKM